jgi:hypothetical protein
MFEATRPQPTGTVILSRLLLSYQDEKSDTLTCTKGSGGLEEFKKHLSPEKACYGYLRMIIGNDELVSCSNLVQTGKVRVGFVVRESGQGYAQGQALCPHCGCQKNSRFLCD